ncbi:MAG: hypothetical protein WC969_15325 [Elusimicrobiota bacterium]
MSDAEPRATSIVDERAYEAARVAWSSLRLLPPEAIRWAIRVLIRQYETTTGKTFDAT